jgi:hypothetical protein
MVETLTVFDEVFVPWKRVFFHGRPDLAGAVVLKFVEYHRFAAVSYCQLQATTSRGASGCKYCHCRQVAWLERYAETIRGLTELAGLRREVEEGLAFPDFRTC